MKVRISGQSIRFRLSKSDIDQLKMHSELSQSTQLGLYDDQKLEYQLLITNADTPLCSFQNNKIRLEIPIPLAKEWLNTEQVGWDCRLQLINDSDLYILVEKDFQCLVPRPHENEENNYPNPLAQKH